MPAADTEFRQRIADALTAFSAQPLHSAALGFFQALGYNSDRRLRIEPATPRNFLAALASDRAPGQAALLADWQAAEFLFQITTDEVRSLAQGAFNFGNRGAYDASTFDSYLFVAVQLSKPRYTRTQLAGVVREINRLFPQPVLVLLRHGDTVSLGIVHRRPGKRDTTRDVLEKVTLIIDIRCAEPLRAHVEILSEFSLDELQADYPFHDFAGLHAAWEKRLATYQLNERFYRDIANWYFWALKPDTGIVYPRDVRTEEDRSIFLIRLLTRLIFCWFLQEKGLIPRDLFRRHIADGILKDGSPKAGTYYRAVLQNLFFATLNQEMDKRGFRRKSATGQRDGNRGVTGLFRYAALLADADALTAHLDEIPFLNGGLFDCLDRVYTTAEKKAHGAEDVRLDDFSEEKSNALHLPNDLFFGHDRLVDLTHIYADPKKAPKRPIEENVAGLVTILSRYKFTVVENTPFEEEIALDPELLGKVFENLLASYNEDTRTTARKATGSFYTPREIVSYMVDEALRAYLEASLGLRALADASKENPPGSLGPVQAKLKELFDPAQSGNPFDEKETTDLIAAIDRVKILDPACGSGAFPMGALHRLTDLLAKLDPNNRRWKEQQLRKVERDRQLAAQMEDEELRQATLAEAADRAADIQRSFDTRFHDLDFARKLYLIENCIYGVDIQPIATQIAKLRFFIALIVDQRHDPAAPNRGVRPLPNLETKLVAADFLIPIERRQTQFQLFDEKADVRRRIEKLKQELAFIRHEHFGARDPRKKERCRAEDARLREEMAGLLRETGMSAPQAAQLARWDPYDQNAHAHFFDSEWMFNLPIGRIRLDVATLLTLRGNFSFLNETTGQMELPAGGREIESGFDVVIANPPYVRHEKISDFRDKLLPHYETAASRADLFVFFFERGTRLLKEHGFLCFISSNKYFRAAYGEKLRQYLAGKMTIHSIVDFGDAPVFKAIAYASIFIAGWHKAPPGHLVQTLTWSDGKAFDQLATRIESEGSEMPQTGLKAEGWNFGAGASGLLERLEAMGQPLKEYVGGRLYRGIITGLNDAFVIDAATRQQLITQDPKSAELIQPWLRGRDVKRWRSHWAELYAIVFPFGFHTELSRYPAVLRHLKEFESDLRQRGQCTSSRGGKGEGQHHWLELDNNPKQSYLDEFTRPKVIIPAIERACAFAYDDEGYFSNDKTTICVSDNAKYLCGVLNSAVTWWVIRQIAAERQNGYYEFKPMYCSRLPIPAATPAQQASIERVVDYLLWLHRQPEVTAGREPRDPVMLAFWEQVVNALVYELFFPAELAAAGLAFFRLVDEAALKPLAELPTADGRKTCINDAERLTSLRTTFERLNATSHPLRAALFTLAGLDFVRLIEGRA